MTVLRPPPRWSERAVVTHLEEAAGIHRRLPEVKVAGYYSLWPQAIADDWSRLYDAVHRRTKAGAPMPCEVTYHEEVMAWLRWLERREQQIVWMRANRIPWKIITAELGQSKTTLWREHTKALTRIAAILNERNRRT